MDVSHATNVENSSASRTKVPVKQKKGFKSMRNASERSVVDTPKGTVTETGVKPWNRGLTADEELKRNENREKQLQAAREKKEELRAELGPKKVSKMKKQTEYWFYKDVVKKPNQRLPFPFEKAPFDGEVRMYRRIDKKQGVSPDQLARIQEKERWESIDIKDVPPYVRNAKVKKFHSVAPEVKLKQQEKMKHVQKRLQARRMKMVQVRATEQHKIEFSAAFNQKLLKGNSRERRNAVRMKSFLIAKSIEETRKKRAEERAERRAKYLESKKEVPKDMTKPWNRVEEMEVPKDMTKPWNRVQETTPIMQGYFGETALDVVLELVGVYLPIALGTAATLASFILDVWEAVTLGKLAEKHDEYKPIFKIHVTRMLLPIGGMVVAGLGGIARGIMEARKNDLTFPKVDFEEVSKESTPEMMGGPNDITTESFLGSVWRYIVNIFKNTNEEAPKEKERFYRFEQMTRVFKTFKDIAKNIVAFFEGIFMSIYEWWYGVPYIGDANSEFVERVMTVLETMTRQTEIARDFVVYAIARPTIVREIEEMHVFWCQSMIAFLSRIDRIEHAILRTAKETYQAWENLVYKPIRLATHAVKRNTPNFWVLYSKPGVGKSHICKALVAKNPQSVYQRTLGSDYWEGYSGQENLVIDELFPDSTNNAKALQAVELLGLTSDLPYPCNTAFANKGEVFFTSKRIIACTNDKNWSDLGLTSVAAFCRRVSEFIEIEPREEYATLSPVGFWEWKKPLKETLMTTAVEDVYRFYTMEYDGKSVEGWKRKGVITWPELLRRVDSPKQEAIDDEIYEAWRDRKPMNERRNAEDLAEREEEIREKKKKPRERQKDSPDIRTPDEIMEDSSKMQGNVPKKEAEVVDDLKSVLKNISEFDKSELLMVNDGTISDEDVNSMSETERDSIALGSNAVFEKMVKGAKSAGTKIAEGFAEAHRKATQRLKEKYESVQKAKEETIKNIDKMIERNAWSQKFRQWVVDISERMGAPWLAVKAFFFAVKTRVVQHWKVILGIVGALAGVATIIGVAVRVFAPKKKVVEIDVTSDDAKKKTIETLEKALAEAKAEGYAVAAPKKLKMMNDAQLVTLPLPVMQANEYMKQAQTILKKRICKVTSQGDGKNMSVYGFVPKQGVLVVPTHVFLWEPTAILLEFQGEKKIVLDSDNAVFTSTPKKDVTIVKIKDPKTAFPGVSDLPIAPAQGDPGKDTFTFRVDWKRNDWTVYSIDQHQIQRLATAKYETGRTPDEMIRYEDAYAISQIPSATGDCGMPMFGFEDNKPVFYGHHVASSNMYCYLQRFSDNAIMQGKSRVRKPKLKAEDYQIRFIRNVDDKLATTIVTETNIQLGKMDALLREKYGETLTLPARLKTEKVETAGGPVYVSPLHIAMLKHQGRTRSKPAWLDSHFVHAWTRARVGVRPLKDPWCLSFDHRHIHSWDFDLTKSPGYPFTKLGYAKRDQLWGKDFVGRRYMSKLQCEYYYGLLDVWRKKTPEQIEEAMLKNDLEETPWIKYVPIYTDSLKDERREREKVAEAKTRIFSGAPDHALVVMNQLLGPFVGFVKAKRNLDRSACMVGIDPHGIEWEMLAQKHKKHKIHLAGDLKAMDASEATWWSWMLEIVFLEWVGEGVRDEMDNETKNLIHNVFYHMTQAYHILGNMIYQVWQGNVSGQALTSIFNSLGFSLCVDAAIAKILVPEGSLPDNFFDIFAGSYYGDDSIISHSFDMDVKEFVRVLDVDFGLKMTSLDKRGEVEYVPFKDLTFLKRGFKEDNLTHLHSAPYPLELIVEYCRWTKKKSPVSEQERMESLMEAAAYDLVHWWGDPKADKVWKDLVEAYQQVLGKPPPVTPTFIMEERYRTMDKGPEIDVERKERINLFVDWIEDCEVAIEMSRERVPDKGKSLKPEDVEEKVQFYVDTIADPTERTFVETRFEPKPAEGAKEKFKAGWDKFKKALSPVPDSPKGETKSTMQSGMTPTRSILPAMGKKRITVCSDSGLLQRKGSCDSSPVSLREIGIMQSGSEDKEVLPSTGEREVDSHVLSALTGNDDSAVVEKASNPSGYVRASANVFRSTNVSEVLTRPFNVGNFVWVPTDAFQTTLGVISFPKDLFKPKILAELSNYKYFRAGVCVKVTMSSTQFTPGSVIVSHVPCVDAAHFATVTANNGSLFHRPCEISAMSRKPTVFIIPWTAPYEWIDLTSPDSIKNYMIGTVWIKVLAPLYNLNGAAGNVVNINVEAFFVEPEVAGYYGGVPPVMKEKKAIMQGKVRKMAEIDEEGKEKSSQGVFSGIARRVSEFAPLLSSIPFIGEAAGIAGGVADVLGPLLENLGLGKPLNVATTKPTIFSFGHSLIHMAGLDDAVRMCEDPDQTLHDGVVPDCQNNLLNIAKVPSFVRLVQWTSGANHGSLIDSVPMVWDNTATTRRPFVDHIKGLYRQWRGGMKFVLNFYLSSLQSAKIFVCYNPINVTMNIDDDLGNVVGEEIDLCGDTRMEFVIPYQYETRWCPIGVNPGYLQFYVVNKTNGPDPTNTNAIRCSVWKAAADDLQLAFFSPSIAAYEPESASMQGIWDNFKGEFPPLAGTANGEAERGLVDDEQVNDARAFLKRYVGICPASGSIDTWAHINDNGSWIDYHKLLRYMFLYHRGSVRVFLDASSVLEDNIPVSYEAQAVSFPFVQFNGNVPVNFISPNGTLDIREYHFEVPYRQMKPYHALELFSNLAPRDNLPHIVNLPAFCRFRRAWGEDYEMGWLLAPPVTHQFPVPPISPTKVGAQVGEVIAPAKSSGASFKFERVSKSGGSMKGHTVRD